MTIAFVFPGQGSQKVGMLAALAAVEPDVLATFAEASEVLGYDLWKLCQEGPEDVLGATERTQPAMLAAGVATWRAWRRHGGAMPAFMSGHSLGEYSALVAGEAIDFRTAVGLVQFRGRAMQAAVPAGQGAMAAILGLDDADVEAACRDAAQGGVVQAANFNSPGQVVIAGETAAVERAIEAAKSRGAKRAIKLPVSVPSHSSLMAPAAGELEARLKSVTLSTPKSVEIYTVDVRTHGDGESIRQALKEQLVKPVRWSQTVQALVARGVRAIVECGPGGVLTGLNRRIDRSKEVAMLSIDDPASLQEALSACQGK
jgi:[acyl-carrier-protein] S-malonyltransferase